MEEAENSICKSIEFLLALKYGFLMKIFLLLVVLLFNFKLSANEGAQSVEDGESFLNRANKSFTIHAQLNLLGSFQFFGRPALSAGYFLSPNFLLILEHSEGSGFLDDISIRTTSIHLKHFVSNKYGFYYRGGFDYSKIEDTSKGFLTDPNSWRYKANVISLTLNVGIQKQWDSWTAGIDIVGATLPISYEFTDVFSSTTEGSNSLKKNQDDDAKSVSLNLAWMYFGYSF